MSQEVTAEQTQAVESILAAKTLYDVLGVSSNAASNLDKAPLRKAYLKISVKVHPDKNPHPQATTAFQRVSEAYEILSDDGARRDYDAELRNPSSGNGSGHSYHHYNNNNHNNQSQNTYYAYDFERSHMPSFQEALFLFATATSMFADSTGSASRTGSAVHAASDFMETLFWAQQLAAGRQQQQQQAEQQQSRSGDSGTNASMAETAAKNPLQTGMALGSGLRALASAQRALGMKKGAAATEKVATAAQMAAVGAAVAQAAGDNPAVQRTLERGSTALKNNPQIGRSLKASLQFASSVVSTLHQAHQEAQAQQQAEQQAQYRTSRSNANTKM